jgi:hypothetical protein
VGIEMSVRICGHQLRVKKPIKPYIFFRRIAGLFVLSLILAAPAYAADPSDKVLITKASSASVPPCFPSKASSMDKTVPRSGMASQNQRTAGSPSAAMVLAMALGIRNVSGPMERAKPVQRTATLKGTSKKCVAQNTGASRIAMER